MCREASALVAGAEADALAGGSPQGQCDLLRGLLCEFVTYRVLLWEFVIRSGCVHVLHKARTSHRKENVMKIIVDN